MNARDLSRFDRFALVAMLLVIVGTGIGFAHIVHRHGHLGAHGRELFGAASYGEMADNILQNGRYVSDTGGPLDRMPLYIGVVMLAKVLGGNAYSDVLIALQGLMALACGMMTHRASARLTSVRWIPGVIALLYAAHLSLQFEHYALRETGLYEFLIVLFFYLATLRPATPIRLVGMALTAALAYYTRPTGVLMIVPLALYTLLLPASSMTTRLRTAGWAVALVIACAVPWQIYQSEACGRITLSATQVGGLNLYKGNSYAFESVSPYIDHDDAGAFIDRLTAQYLSSHPDPEQRSEPAVDNHLRQLAQADIDADYARFLRRAMLRVLIYLSPLETPLGTASLDTQGNRVVLNDYRGNFVDADANWVPFLDQLSFFVVLFTLPLGLLGALRGVADPALRSAALASLAFLLANIAAHAAITAETRYRLYLDPVFLIWSGVAIAGIFSAVRGPSHGGIADIPHPPLP